MRLLEKTTLSLEKGAGRRWLAAVVWRIPLAQKEERALPEGGEWQGRTLSDSGRP